MNIKLSLGKEIQEAIMTIPAKLPVYYEFNQNKLLGTATIESDGLDMIANITLFEENVYMKKVRLVANVGGKIKSRDDDGKITGFDILEVSLSANPMPAIDPIITRELLVLYGFKESGICYRKGHFRYVFVRLPKGASGHGCYVMWKSETLDQHPIRLSQLKKLYKEKTGEVLKS